MKIGVSGGSGHLGGTTLAELVARGGGHRIVAISRTPDAIAAPIEARFGDYDDPASLAVAYQGLDRLLIIPTSNMEPGARARQNVAAMDAAVAAGVQHVVYISGTGIRAVEEPNIWASYYVTEQYLMRVAPNWTALRMNYYAETMSQEILTSVPRGMLTGLGDNKVAFVSRDDLAAAAAGVLTGEGHHGAIYNITGPQSLTGPERAAVAAEVTGTPFSYVTLTKAQLMDGLGQAGLPPALAGAVVSIQESFVAGAMDIVTGDVALLAGRPPRSLKEVLAATMAAQG